MRNRIGAVFVVGVLAGALLLGGGVFALQSFGGDAEAQSGGTWNVATFFFCELTCSTEDWYWSGSTTSQEVTAAEFVSSVPASCQLQPMVLAGGEQFVLFHNCPVTP